MNYWIRMILELAVAMGVYWALYRYAKPLKSWTIWVVLMLAVNTTITYGATLLVQSTGWNDLYVRIPLEGLSIGAILAFAPRRPIVAKKPAENQQAEEEKTEQRPGLKKRKKPKI